MSITFVKALPLVKELLVSWRKTYMTMYLHDSERLNGVDIESYDAVHDSLLKNQNCLEYIDTLVDCIDNGRFNTMAILLDNEPSECDMPLGIMSYIVKHIFN